MHWCGRAQWHCRKPGVSAQKGAGTTSDGAFGFNAIEIDTAVRHKAPVVIVVANNGAWQIEVHDQTVTHGKVVGTKLQFSDHAAMARAFGMYGERVEKAAELGPALDRAFVYLKPDPPGADPAISQA